MAPTQTKTFIVNEQPIKNVNYELGQKHSTFKLVDQTLQPLQDGHVRVKTLYLSNDPTQRSWIQKGINPERMYVPPVGQGEPMRSLGIGQVVESKSSTYKNGDLVICLLYWSQYCDIDEQQIDSKVPDASIPLPVYLSTLGMTGLTAYFGIREVAKAKKGDTVVVSAASGATGSMVVQIAKAIGCHVIGISGGEEKCRYVESIGADACVNYKDPAFRKNMVKALGDKKFCDVFFDNVGGDILDVMLALTKVNGTIVACGAIAGYNDHTKMQIRNWGEIIVNRLTVKGFIILDHKDKYGAAVKEIAGWIKEGKVKADESAFNLVDLTGESKFTEVPIVWGTLFSDNKKPGKLLTKLADPKL
ncbi:hypothetical protein QFC19_009051 [Naganishia cerealis]|uniref:Uncharacterized protein n=1 Tax=Naganishia cerealis TaxID=610337 RepID=A0ACC2UXM5_9TREE|nr:hypothetical protein QFC19_009051 [Naganishia cerealis]